MTVVMGGGTVDDSPPPYLPLSGGYKNRNTGMSESEMRHYDAIAIPLLVTFLTGVAVVAYLCFTTPLTQIDSAFPENPDPFIVGPRLSDSPRGVREGVSSKESGVRYLRNATSPFKSFRWTAEELRWQRTAYHFQPEKNWMNDPNSPLYYKGWYHIFYQYNPDSAVWGNITWAHAASRDLIHWVHLPVAMVRDKWYDADGAWTGSATILPDGRVVMVYTGSTSSWAQVQNLVVPVDPDDPLLINWTKSDSNPIIYPPFGVDEHDFRDPTTAWYEPSESAWRMAIGSKDVDGAGIILLYNTTDFVHFELLPELLHRVNGTGMWECVDFYPVSTTSGIGLDTSYNGRDVKHVLKASLDDERNDYYAIGTYVAIKGKWHPDDRKRDVGFGLRYDYGKFYAAKTFYDPEKKRRVLWGWIGEADSEIADVQKGWASIMAIPRTVELDRRTMTHLLQWPVEEVERLRVSRWNFSNVEIGPRSVVPLEIGTADQLDITVEFELSIKALEMVAAMSPITRYNCSTSGGVAGRGRLGPFGLLVLADEILSEQTAVYFYVAKSTQGKLDTFVCHDEMRSSVADDTVKQIAGSIVPVVDGESLHLRILVDHSVVETFAQGGRTCISSRVYPTRAIYGEAKVFLFNNATNAIVTAKSVNVWELKKKNVTHDCHYSDRSITHIKNSFYENNILEYGEVMTRTPISPIWKDMARTYHRKIMTRT